jgi:hypothetical protein
MTVSFRKGSYGRRPHWGDSHIYDILAGGEVVGEVYSVLTQKTKSGRLRLVAWEATDLAGLKVVRQPTRQAAAAELADWLEATRPKPYRRGRVSALAAQTA